jgi:hypothetical protein
MPSNSTPENLAVALATKEIDHIGVDLQKARFNVEFTDQSSISLSPTNPEIRAEIEAVREDSTGRSFVNMDRVTALLLNNEL